MIDARDKVIAEQARELTRWKHRAERAEALVELQKKWRRYRGRPPNVDTSSSLGTTPNTIMLASAC